MTLLKADPSQFQLTETGNVLFQKTLNNPTLGDVVAKLTKGENVYSIGLELVESDHVKTVGESEATRVITEWLVSHIETVLEPLKRLETTDVLRKKEGSDTLEPVEFSEEARSKAKAVMDKLYEHMGVVHRSDLNQEIAALDEEARKILRAKRVKLGPILVFLPELNKPKGVRLRGLLWSLWNDQPLPAQLPADGASSISVDLEAVNKDLYQAVSYPVFGKRAIRIDMLDRVINAVYDSAKEGKFQAQHSMAEWLGCSIDDLYAVLSAMGHKRIETDKEATSDETAEKTADEKPQLDFFWLKKGQAHKAAAQKPSFKKNDHGKSFDKNKKKPFKKGQKKPSRKEPVVISAQAETRPEDNPFAVLEQLKSK